MKNKEEKTEEEINSNLKQEIAQIMIESTMIGIDNRVGSQEAVSAFLDHFIAMMKYATKVVPNEELEQTWKTISDELLDSGIIIDVKIDCCPNKKKIHKGE